MVGCWWCLEAALNGDTAGSDVIVDLEGNDLVYWM